MIFQEVRGDRWCGDWNDVFGQQPSRAGLPVIQRMFLSLVVILIADVQGDGRKIE